MTARFAGRCRFESVAERTAREVELISLSYTNDMETLEERILRVLEQHDGRCLDTQGEREIVARALCQMLRQGLSADAEAMPRCFFCGHQGPDHNWIVPPCSKERCDCFREHPRRIRGACLMPGCPCRGYGPRTDQPRPLNRYIGRGRRRR